MYVILFWREGRRTSGRQFRQSSTRPWLCGLARESGNSTDRAGENVSPNCPPTGRNISPYFVIRSPQPRSTLWMSFDLWQLRPLRQCPIIRLVLVEPEVFREGRHCCRGFVLCNFEVRSEFICLASPIPRAIRIISGEHVALRLIHSNVTLTDKSPCVFLSCNIHFSGSSMLFLNYNK